MSDTYETTWWDEAVMIANIRARNTHRRQRVRQWLRGWIVEPAVDETPC